jgi:hypothetical protein
MQALARRVDGSDAPAGHRAAGQEQGGAHQAGARSADRGQGHEHAQRHMAKMALDARGE